MKISGDLNSGLILEAPRPQHLGGTAQYMMILTPAEVRSLIEQLDALRNKEGSRGGSAR